MSTNAPKIQFAAHASEGSSHWYTRDGRQITAIPKVGGKGMKKPTLTDARKPENLWMPGVTTIIRESSAPALERWKIKQAVLAALTLPRAADETDDDYINRILEDSRLDVEAAADEGTAIHAAIQEFFVSGKLTELRYQNKLEAVIDLLERWPGVQWIPEKVAICPLGYGTKVDLFARVWLDEQCFKDIILDFKTKEGNAEKISTLGTYESHWKQLAAGARAMASMLGEGEPAVVEGAICYISRTHDEAVLMGVSEDEMSKGLAMFDCNLTHWKLRTGYDPASGVSR